MISVIKKRDDRVVPFDINKIEKAIFSAAKEVGDTDKVQATSLAFQVHEFINDNYFNTNIPSVEDIQDLVEKVLVEAGHYKTAKAYILYRAERTKKREAKSDLIKTVHEITFSDAADSDLLRENANINGDAPMGVMYKYGSETSKYFAKQYLMDPKHAKAHNDGLIHIHK